MFVYFGGGNVNIRIKLILIDFLFKVDIGIFYNINNSDIGYFYEGGDDDWMGCDDGICVLFIEIINVFYGIGFEGDINIILVEC